MRLRRALPLNGETAFADTAAAFAALDPAEQGVLEKVSNSDDCALRVASADCHLALALMLISVVLRCNSCRCADGSMRVTRAG